MPESLSPSESRTAHREAGDPERSYRQCSSDASAVRIVALCGNMVTPHGLEFAAFQMLGNLRQHGATVHCIVNDWENHRIVALAEDIGATWSAGPYSARINRGSLQLKRLLGTGRALAAASADLVGHAKRLGATHVLVPDFAIVLRTAPGLAALRRRGVKVVFQVSTAPSTERFYPRLWRYGVAPFIDTFVPNSQFTRRELAAVGVPSRKIADPIYPAIDRPPSPVSPVVQRDPHRLVFIGQTIPDKGLHVLLDAIGILVGRGYTPTLDVVGQMDGWEHPGFHGYRDKLLSRAHAPDLAGRIRFLGYTRDVPLILAGAGIHCCPSLPAIREAFGLVNVEAKRAGLPSVVFPSGALGEVVTHGVDGWVCNEATAESLAEGIQFFFDDPVRAQRFGAMALASAERFSTERTNEAWMSIVHQATST